MWGHRVVAALVASAVVGTGITAADAAVDPKLTVTSVTADRTTIAVSGLNTVPVKLTVAAKYDTANPDDNNLVLLVYIKRISGTGPMSQLLSTDLPRTSGTVQNGVWSGPVHIPSTANGTYKVYGVSYGPYFTWQAGGMLPDPTPVDGPTLTITGTHQPKVTAKVTPAVVPFGPNYTITWAITDRTTGKPYGTRVRALLGVDNQCAEEAGGANVLTTTGGLVSYSYPSSAGESINCLRIKSTPLDITGLGLAVIRPGVVSAVPSKTSATVGTIVPVNGSVLGPAAFCPVLLQRLYGASQWRGVSTAKTRQSGRYTVSAQPAYKGLIPYRVYFPKCGRYLVGVSRVFYIRGV
ncbi:hypothetical protein [Kribbella sp. VKM Ac-2566]|uniref:hypothetical protein n=1 Tax=Kribbella sp. VKM Ac-2566 TaxID=2512218 RepID=UPI0010628A2B|nr:hypothetical protein [Kribbella sp. VKM Ac-2566]TDX08824.1 hypothetical protein EV647_0165 [Kribbella sp. VKM Ac-2566]